MAQPVLRSRRTTHSTATAAAVATQVRTSVYDVPVLNAAPGLRARKSVSTSPTTCTGGSSYTLVLTCVATAAAVAVLWVVRRLRSTGWAIGLGFLMAGVLGNLTDRVFRSPGGFRGHVVDFIQLPNWPIFNVADVCINIAAGVIILQAVRGVSIDGSRSRPRDTDDPAAAP